MATIEPGLAALQGGEPTMSSITKTSHGTYRLRWRNPQGQDRNRSFMTRREAEGYERVLNSDLYTGRYVDPGGGKTRLDDWLDQWHSARLNLRPSTQSRDTTIINTHITHHLGHQQLRQTTPAVIRNWIATLSQTLSPATVHKAHQLLNAALNTAVGDGLIPTNPASGIPLPRVEIPTHRYLTIDETHHLADTIDPRYQALVLTGAHTGLRPGELAALTVDNLNLLRRTLHVERTATEIAGTLTYGPPKTKASNRTISIGNSLVDTLAQHIATYPTDTGFVFTSSEGNPIRWTNLRRRQWRQAVMDSVGTPCTPNDLRHSHAALSIAAGVHPKVLSSRMGHSKIGVTMDTYGGLFAGFDEGVADALDEAFSARRVSDSRQKSTGDVIDLPGQ